MNEKLWCDCETLTEKIELLETGRAWESGIIARAIVPDIVKLLKELAAFRTQEPESIQQMLDMLETVSDESFEVFTEKFCERFGHEDWPGEIQPNEVEFVYAYFKATK